MAGSDIVLYWGSGSTPCWRVQLVLEEKGLSGYESKLVDFFQMEHKSREIMALNPRGQVPTFTDDKISVNESHAICDYLVRRYHHMGNKLLPDDWLNMSRVLQRMHEAHNNFQQFLIQNILYYCWKTDKDKWDQAILEKNYIEARTELKRWEEYLKEAHEEDREYIVGDKFSLADVYLFPHVAFCVRFGLDISKYPHLKIYYELLQERESIRKTWPPSWEEAHDPSLMFFAEL